LHKQNHSSIRGQNFCASKTIREFIAKTFAQAKPFVHSWPKFFRKQGFDCRACMNVLQLISTFFIRAFVAKIFAQAKPFEHSWQKFPRKQGFDCYACMNVLQLIYIFLFKHSKSKLFTQTKLFVHSWLKFLRKQNHLRIRGQNFCASKTIRAFVAKIST
jgi:hypothetical protein